jgi:hypothetical protein
VSKARDGINGSHESNGKASSQNAQTSHDSPTLILPPRGDYQTLLSYQKSEVIYQITYRFCERYLKKGDRTVDQMVQAARSGKQNIVEGSKAATTSKEMTNLRMPVVKNRSTELPGHGFCPRCRENKVFEPHSLCRTNLQKGEF